MTDTLAIYTPKIGERSETFIKRHIDSVYPGRTVVIAGSRVGAQWSVQCPALILDELSEPRFANVLFRACLEKAGWKHENPEIRAIREFLCQHQVTGAMGEYLNTALPWLEVCRDLGIRFYGHAHGYDVSQLLRSDSWREAYRKYQMADGIIVVNHVQRSRLIDLGLDEKRIHVVPCGVEVPDIPPTHRGVDGFIYCLSVGRMVPKKAPVLCLDAFRRAAEVIPALHLNYVGTGEQLASARQFVQAFKLEDRVDLMGGQPHEVIRDLMMKSDIYIQHGMTDQVTGDEEGLPVAIMEAMAHGLPIISTRHAGIPDAVVDQGTGLLVEEGDSVGMAKCLVELANDAELRRSMGREGWCRAKELFTWERERDSLQEIMGLTPLEL